MKNYPSYSVCGIPAKNKLASRVCKCIDPPNKYFVKGNAYKFVPKIIDIKVYGDGGVVWSVPKARFLLHFEPIRQREKDEILSK